MCKPQLCAHMKTPKLLALAAFTLLALSRLHAQLAWNPTAELSNTANPNGAWSYGWMDTSFSTFTLYTQTSPFDPGHIGWKNTALDMAIWRNDGTNTDYGVAPGQLTLSPGTGSEASVLRWIAPAGVSGPMQVSGEFFAGDINSPAIAIFGGETKTIESTLFSGTNAGTFDFSVTVAPGDMLNFAVYGLYSYGNTPLTLTITSAIPEPSTYAALCGVGALGLALWRRWRRPA